MSELPNGWARVVITDACEFNPKKPKEWPIKEKDEVSFVPMPAVDAEFGTMDTSDNMALEKVKKGYTYFQNNDVLMAKITPCMENGKAAIARNLKNNIGFGSTEFHVFRDIGLVLPEYMFYYLRQSILRREAESYMTGAVGQRRVPKAYFERKLIPVPPRDEQRRIVKKLDTIFEQLNESKARLNRVPDLLKKFRQSVLSKAVSGELLNSESDGVDELLAGVKEFKLSLIENKSIRRPSELPSLEKDDLPLQIPRNWRFVRLQELVSHLGDGLHGTPEYSERGTHHFINGNNLQNGKIVIKEKTKTVTKGEALKHKKELNDQTVLVSINGTLGNVAFYNGENVMLGKSACYFNLLPGLNKEFIKIILDSPYFQKYSVESATGSTIKNVPLKAMKMFPLPVPPPDIQEQIVNKVSNLFNDLNTIEAVYAGMADKIEHLYSAVLKFAFEGRLIEQNPNDESASVLLEKIQADREAAKPKKKTNKNVAKKKNTRKKSTTSNTGIPSKSAVATGGKK